MHIIVSANQLDQSSKHSLSTKVFDQIKRNAEAYVLEHYPEMEQEKLINQTQEDKLKASSQREQAFQKRTGKKSDKQLFKELLETLMRQANNDEQFRELLDLHGIAYTYKPANITLTNPNTNSKRNTHRLKTLGLHENYEAMLARGQKQSEGVTQEPETQQKKTRQQSQKNEPKS